VNKNLPLSLANISVRDIGTGGIFPVEIFPDDTDLQWISGGYANDRDPLVKKTIDYTIHGFSGDTLLLYRSSRVSEFNNGTPPKTETFPDPWQKGRGDFSGISEHFSDTAGKPFSLAINILAEKNIVQGFGDGTF